MEKNKKGAKSICLPFSDKSNYKSIFFDNEKLRTFINNLYNLHPELFPKDFERGFIFRGSTECSKKQNSFQMRRIELKASEEVYQIRPSFMMPYMVAYTNDIEKAVYLMRFDIPFYALTYVFGHNDMFWYRIHNSFGRNPIVGTTVKSPEKLPVHTLADEKHTWLKKTKVFIATIVGKGCILGAEVVKSASEIDLTEGYSIFKEEAQNLKPDYEPTTFNTDGWGGTKKALKSLFPDTTLIQCFLHSFIKIRDRCKSAKDVLSIIREKVWDLYHAETTAQFSQRLRHLKKWAQDNVPVEAAKEKLLELCDKGNLFKIAYKFKGCHRTSNALDRLMNYQDRILYGMKYFHRTIESAKLYSRAMALLWNFHPYSSRLKYKGNRISPFADLNGFIYHENWLHNMLVASSLGGFR